MAFGEKYGWGEVEALAPGVMAQTGMESFEIVKGIVEQTKPDLVIAVDALAASMKKAEDAKSSSIFD